jgi:hypothetical protein
MTERLRGMVVSRLLLMCLLFWLLFLLLLMVRGWLSSCGSSRI